MRQNNQPEPPTTTNTAAVIVAAGSSSRMGGVDKIFASVAGRSVIAHSLVAFEQHPHIGAVVIVFRPDLLNKGAALVSENKCTKVQAIVTGGDRRRDSVEAGLDALPETCRWVLIHDGARPCLRPEIINRGLATAGEFGAAVAAVPVKDTIKIVETDKTVVETADRTKLWAVQTPQIFRLDVLRAAYNAISEETTDDAALVEKLGHGVKVFMGSYENIKVTTTEDLEIVEAFLKPAGEAGR